MIEPRTADEGVLAVLYRAKAMVEGNDFDAAVTCYSELLDTDLTAPLRGEVLTNLGAALCMLGRARQGQSALAALDEARDRLVSALQYRPRAVEPDAWVTTHANMALVYLARYDVTGSSEELLSAHLALDGVEQIIRSTNQSSLRDWVLAIRDQLLELRERRSKKR